MAVLSAFGIALAIVSIYLGLRTGDVRLFLVTIFSFLLI